MTYFAVKSIATIFWYVHYNGNIFHVAFFIDPFKNLFCYFVLRLVSSGRSPLKAFTTSLVSKTAVVELYRTSFSAVPFHSRHTHLFTKYLLIHLSPFAEFWKFHLFLLILVFFTLPVVYIK